MLKLWVSFLFIVILTILLFWYFFSIFTNGIWVILYIIIWLHERVGSQKLFQLILRTYSVTVSFGRGDGIRVSPLFEQSTTTPDDEQEHSAGQSLDPALTNNLEFVYSEKTIHVNIKIVLIFIPHKSFSFGFIVKV